MPLAPLASAPRVISVPVTTGTGARTSTGTCDKVTRIRTSPFETGQSVLALSAGAGDIWGVPAPWGDKTRHLQFQISGSDISIANGVVSQIAATGGRASASKVTTDLTVALGQSGGRLAYFGAIPTAATSVEADDMLKAILLVNGVVYTRILDANTPAPAALEWGLDANTDAGYTLVIGADSTNYLPVGATVDILIPDTTTYLARLAKPGVVAGAALAAGVAEERLLGVPYATSDTAGRSVNRLARVDFVAANTAAVSLLGLSK